LSADLGQCQVYPLNSKGSFGKSLLEGKFPVHLNFRILLQHPMSTDLARQRLIQLFQFFKAVEDRRTPIVSEIRNHSWAMWLHSLPRHELIHLERPSPDSGEWLKVTKPNLSPCPHPSEILKGWLDDGWENPSIERPTVLKERIEKRGEDYVRVVFEADKSRLTLFSEWNAKRTLWRERELPLRQVLAVWERMFSLHNDLQRDGESWELVLGDGIFSYSGGSFPIFHPVMVRKVEHIFDSATLQFTFADSDSRPELYTPLFANALFAELPIKSWQESLEEGDFHPLDAETFDHWLKGLVGNLKNGSFTSSLPPETSDQPRMGRGAVLFLRSRSAGRSQFIDQILQHLPTATEFPSSLLRIVGISPPPETTAEEEVNGAYANEQDDVILTKPANAEQVAILRRLSKRDGVLVQGPPGTGKTHTIANLVGSFLAEGKSVLVTSHATKALRVLRSQVASPLQSLCVSILDSNAQSRVEREMAIRELASRLSDNPDQYRQRAEGLRQRRSALLQDIRAARSELLTSVHGEYVPIVLNGEQIDPAKAAREVATGAEVHEWLIRPIDPQAPCPITDAEALQLIQSSNRISDLHEAELIDMLPTLDSLPTSEQFQVWIAELNGLNESDLGFRSELWSGSVGSERSLELVHQRLTDSVQFLKQLSEAPWKLGVLQAGMERGQAEQIWKLLCENIGAVRQKAEACSRTLFEFGPEFPEDSPLDEQLRILGEIGEYLKSNTSISWLRLTVSGKWKWHIERWRVSGRSPKTLDDFIALRECVELAIERKSLIERWGRLMGPLGVTSLVDVSSIQPEDYANQYVGQIQSLLAWHDSVWTPVAGDLSAEGLAWSRLLDEAPPANTIHHLAERLRHTVERSLPAVVSVELRRRRRALIQSQLDHVNDSLNTIQAKRANPSIVIRSLIEATRSGSHLSYAKAWSQLRDLDALIQIFNQRRGLLERLKPLAPVWTEMAASRQPGIAPDWQPLEFQAAWRWLQLAQELDRRATLSPQAIQERIQRLTKELRHTTTELVEALAWAGLLRKVTNEQRQALLGWAQTMKRIGAGTGRMVPMLRRQAMRDMEKARGAVPVWIMPFNEVTSSFHPIRDKFDVIIVDEASQEDVLGIAPFYLANKVIVVGDDEQVTPLDVGSLQEPIHHLINQWLGDLPSPKLFDLKTSVYDRAQIAFGSVIRLKEHFRCVPEIIQFSNSLCYDFSIKPLRESASSVLKPALVAHRVNGYTQNKTNQEEAQEIVVLIRACIEHPAYAEKTIGVISMVGDQQAVLIGSLLRAQIDPSIYEKRRILCGNPAQFQGDERDVIFLSLVDSKDDGIGPLTMRQDGSDGMWKKRFNVAASRAKDQLWVVYSMDHLTQLKPGDIRRRLIEHAINPSALMEELKSGLRETESPFEAEVLTLLTSKGYRVHPQWQVGAYRIDLVVEGHGKRLAVECDGERWHYDKVEEDLARQALLERLGWIFVRIRGSTFYRDRTPHRSEAMQPVFNKLSELGIHPGGYDVSQAVESGNELLESIKRRAFELKKNVDKAHSVATEEPSTVVIAEATFPIPSATGVTVSTHEPAETKKETSQNPSPIIKQPDQLQLNEITDPVIQPSAHEAPQFRKGMRIKHITFGEGVVVSVRSFGDKVHELEIKFDNSSMVKVVKPTATNLQTV
jgi:very-short-patch-repair endonuclease